MAMKDYTSELVHTGYCNGNKSLPIKLRVAYKSTQDTANNKSTVYCGMYVTTPSSTYIGPWTDFNGSYVGTKSNTFTASIKEGFTGKKWLAENKSFTVKHDASGNATSLDYKIVAR